MQSFIYCRKEKPWSHYLYSYIGVIARFVLELTLVYEVPDSIPSTSGKVTVLKLLRFRAPEKITIRI